MRTLRHILVLVDLCRRSRRTVATAMAAARATGARITLLHVVRPFLDAERREELLMRVSGLVTREDRDLPAHADVIEGDAVRESLAFAAAYGVDLMVVGARHRSALDRLVGPSIGDAISREAQCPVLVVGEPAEGDPGPEARAPKVLCGVDLGAASRETVELAVAVAGGAPVTVVHVIDPWSAVGPGPGASHAIEEVQDALERSAAERLSLLVAPYAATGIAIDAMVSFGLVAPQIVATAAEIGATLLVLDTRSKRVLGRTYIGSTADYVRKNAACPVLLARPAQPAGDGSSVNPPLHSRR